MHISPTTGDDLDCGINIVSLIEGRVRLCFHALCVGGIFKCKTLTNAMSVGTDIMLVNEVMVPVCTGHSSVSHDSKLKYIYYYM